MKKICIYLICLVSVLFSCSSERDTQSAESMSNALLAQMTSAYIDKDTENISSADAMKMAQLLTKNSVNGPRRAQTLANQTPSVKVVCDSISNEPLFYIVNYGNDNGFTILSATKKCHPVLAFSETGSFDIDNLPFNNEYIEEYKTLTSKAIADESDSLRNKYALEWALYERAEVPMLAAIPGGFNGDVSQAIQDEIARKTAQGYTYIGTISTAANYLSPEEYQNLVRDISSHSNPDYDYQQTSLLFIKSYDYTQIGPLLQTNWHQGWPYSGSATNKIAGCVPVAIGQIAFYHKFPNKYNWDDIYAYGYSASLVYMMDDIRNLCNVRYKEKSTGCSYDDAKRALRNLGYNITEGGVPNAGSLATQIGYHKPVYIRGEKSGGEGHAWVCDGYRDKRIIGSISYLPFDLPENIDTPFNEYAVKLNRQEDLSSNSTGEFFHMNMGWNGNYNGWYRANSFMPLYDDNFTTNQKSIFISK